MDTGRAGTIGGRNLDSLLGKSYFAKHGLLPPKKFLEALHEFPAPDFDNSAGSGTGSITRTKAQVRANHDNLGNFGWDLGAAKEQLLIIVGGMRPSQFAFGPAGFSVVPATSDTSDTDMYASDLNVFNAKPRLLKGDNGGFSDLAGDTSLVVQGGFEWSVALYWEPNVQKMYVRQGHENWIEVCTATDALIATMEAAGIFWSGQGTGTKTWATCPIGIYTD